MNLRLILVLVLSNLRNLRIQLIPMSLTALGVACWIPVAALTIPDADGFRIGVKARGLPEIARVLGDKGFKAVEIGADEPLDLAARDLAAGIEIIEPADRLPRRARITFPDGQGNLTLDTRIRDAIMSAGDLYSKRLAKEAGLPDGYDMPIAFSRTSDGPLSKVAPYLLGLLDSGKFIPPIMLTICMTLGLFGVLPVLIDAFNAPRAGGRLEALFPIRLRPREMAASLIATQVVIAVGLTLIVAVVTQAASTTFGLAYKPGFMAAILASPIVSICACPFITATSTLFRTPIMTLFACGLVSATAFGLAYLPTLMTALGLSAGAVSVWPVHGLLTGDAPHRIASLGLTLVIGALGFLWSCSRLDGRVLLRIDQ